MRNLNTHQAVQVYASPDARLAPLYTLPRGYPITDLEPAAPNTPPAGWIQISFVHPTTMMATSGFVQNVAGAFDVQLPAPVAPPTPVPVQNPWLPWLYFLGGIGVSALVFLGVVALRGGF